MSDTTHSDIIIVGAGPAGLAFARYFKGSELRLTIIEKAPLSSLQNPAYDGREIALTNRSKEILQNLGAWQRFNPDEIYPLVDAKVYSGTLDYALHFQVPSLMKSMRSLDRLGNLISNHNIRKAIYDEVATMDNVTLITEIGVTDVKTDDVQATVSLADGRTLTADLVIAADSRLSGVRRMLGIGADMHDFGRTVIVFRVSHPLSNGATAQEYFLYGRTLALLPLNDHLTNCVITLDNTQADALLSLSPQALASEAQRMFGDQFGTFSIAGSVHHYPLMGVHAHQFHAKRAALIGDAAVGMHPVTAHGYNLGLISADILAPLIIEAHRMGRDIASDRLLATFNRRHQVHTRPLYHGTNAMVSLFTDDRKPVRAVRDLALRVSNNLPPVKHWIAKQLVG
ncbi:5-demethoxyubiquinol-8 5-hydroxylase UbiM [uncultured Moraxella sp.]|uniref:5-demethoxyubiquinol-8 5-hydroxylase UbiM n=1 Tax=uncultured Moraxella sp. TaxID=263769 RepID=UPI0025FF462F|nr:5-demethoxyubiquinol-8 5-hydroxylase UbiM [uncultured Moraxella sp.]